MAQQFALVCPEAIANKKMAIQKREISCLQYCDKAVWFSFDVICNLPRSQLDYLEIAELFNTVFVSDIPVFNSSDTVKVILFMHFIDVMYDNGVKVVNLAAVSADDLYTKGALYQEFQRTVSRLHEMQSVDYMSS
jgi:cell division protein ZapE